MRRGCVNIMIIDREDPTEPSDLNVTLSEIDIKIDSDEVVVLFFNFTVLSTIREPEPG